MTQGCGNFFGFCFKEELEIWPCVPGGKDSHTLNRKGLKNAVLQDDAALQVSKFFENPLRACMYFAQKK